MTGAYEELVQNVLTALQQFVFGVDLLDRAAGIVADEVFRHHDIAGLRHGEIRFGGYDEPERLQIRSGEQFGMVALQDHLAEIIRPALRSDTPQYVCHVFRSELAGRRHMVQGSLDLGGSHLARHTGFPPRGGHQFGAAKIDMGGAGTMVIIDGLGGPRNYRNAKDRGSLAGLDRGRHGLLLSRIGNLRCHDSRRQQSQNWKSHTVCVHSFGRVLCKRRADVLGRTGRHGIVE